MRWRLVTPRGALRTWSVLAAAIVLLSAACSSPAPPASPAGPTSAPQPSSSPSSTPSSSAAVTTTAADAPPLTDATAAELAADLASGDAGRFSAAVELPSDGYTPDAQEFADLTIAFDTATFVDGHDGTATITASADGSDWIVHLVADHGQWKLAATEPAAP